MIDVLLEILKQLKLISNNIEELNRSIKSTTYRVAPTISPGFVPNNPDFKYNEVTCQIKTQDQY